MKTEFKGVFPALVTPLTASEKLNTRALKSLIEYEKVQVEKLQAEKWNGVLPQAIYTGTPLPILNVK